MLDSHSVKAASCLIQLAIRIFSLGDFLNLLTKRQFCSKIVAIPAFTLCLYCLCGITSRFLPLLLIPDRQFLRCFQINDSKPAENQLGVFLYICTRARLSLLSRCQTYVADPDLIPSSFLPPNVLHLLLKTQSPSSYLKFFTKLSYVKSLFQATIGQVF